MKQKPGQTCHIKMVPAHWELLERYRQIINKKLREQNQEPVTQAQLAGAIVAYVLQAHSPTILDEHATIRHERVLRTPGLRTLLRDVATLTDADVRGARGDGPRGAK